MLSQFETDATRTRIEMGATFLGGAWFQSAIVEGSSIVSPGTLEELVPQVKDGLIDGLLLL